MNMREIVFFFKQKTAYEMRISDWSSDVCSSDLTRRPSALTCASCALLWVCSASRDRPTLLMSATALMSSSQKAAAILSQRVRESRSDGAWGRVMAASPRAGLRPARTWRCRAGWREEVGRASGRERVGEYG